MLQIFSLIIALTFLLISPLQASENSKVQSPETAALFERMYSDKLQSIVLSFINKKSERTSTFNFSDKEYNKTYRLTFNGFDDEVRQKDEYHFVVASFIDMKDDIEHTLEFKVQERKNKYYVVDVVKFIQK